MKFSNIGVIGAGGWGTTLATLLHRKNFNVTVFTHEINIIKNIKEKGENLDYLPGFKIPQDLKITNDSSELKDSDLIVNAIPTQYIRSSIKNFKLPIEGKYIVNGSKGIEVGTLKRISEIFYEIANIDSNKYAVLTGPSHAEEVSKQHPTTVVVASENPLLSKEIQDLFNTNFFRVYTSDDLVGCELGGALKNVVAIAAGVIEGLELGDNTKAALITRGLAEISRLGIALGAKPLTFSGLSGLGDLFVTCNSQLSRNRKVGELLGKGMTLKQIRAEMKMVAEGTFTTESAYHLSKLHHVEMPITTQMYKILFENVNPIVAIEELMSRETKKEWWW